MKRGGVPVPFHIGSAAGQAAGCKGCHLPQLLQSAVRLIHATRRATQARGPQGGQPAQLSGPRALQHPLATLARLATAAATPPLPLRAPRQTHWLPTVLLGGLLATIFPPARGTRREAPRWAAGMWQEGATSLWRATHPIAARSRLVKVLGWQPTPHELMNAGCAPQS